MMMRNLGKIDHLIDTLLKSTRIPGAAIAVVADGRMIFSAGYGCRDLIASLPITSGTVYPIASTSKAVNATLLALLVAEGRLSWDVPVRHYLPTFRLGQDDVGMQVTLRDLVTMRTGLPRHDWAWIENPVGRAVLIGQLGHLPLSAGLKERFQYNNLTVTAAGHIAEIVTGQSWEQLVQCRILDPLQMNDTLFAKPAAGNIILSYHETADRDLRASRHWATEVTAPSGGAIYSTVDDMARWMLVNLEGGRIEGKSLIEPSALAELHRPQIIVEGDEAPEFSNNPAYAMGWFADIYRGHTRLFHGGFLNDVNSEVMLFPEQRIGIVSFINLAMPNVARLISQHVFDLLMGDRPAHLFDQKLAQYEARFAEARQREMSLHRDANAVPSHLLDHYAGCYHNDGYGLFHIDLSDGALTLRRNTFILPLEHWHHDAWVAQESGLFAAHLPHAFDRTQLLQFERSADGKVAAVALPLESAVAPIRFKKR